MSKAIDLIEKDHKYDAGSLIEDEITSILERMNDVQKLLEETEPVITKVVNDWRVSLTIVSRAVSKIAR